MGSSSSYEHSLLDLEGSACSRRGAGVSLLPGSGVQPVLTFIYISSKDLTIGVNLPCNGIIVSSPHTYREPFHANLLTVISQRP